MLYPFLLTTIAGLATMLGTIPIFIKFKNTDKIISSSCAFAAGVMLCISTFDLIPESINYISINNTEFITILYSFIFIVLGVFTSYLIDNYIEKINKNSNLYKVGLLSMIAIILHNIPEGIVTFIVSGKNILLGASICTAISLHNIPEGISISVPIYYSEKSKKKAILYTFISAMSEPFGALITYLILYKYINNQVLGLLFSFIAGIMIQISINKLIPTSNKYNKKLSYIFIIIGFIIMLLSLFINLIS